MVPAPPLTPCAALGALSDVSEPQCSHSQKRWINEIWHIHAMEYYSTMIGNKALIHALNNTSELRKHDAK